jgi:hypothetical protein
LFSSFFSPYSSFFSSVYSYWGWSDELDCA